MSSIKTLDEALKRCQNQNTKDILRSCIRGYYVNNQNEDIQIADQIQKCLINTESYPPDYVFKLPPLEKKEKGVIEIRNETTIRAALRMVVEEGKKNVCALNFANAFHPGGGVLHSANAQEESICRSSALYYSLIQKNDFYEYHKEIDTNIASNYLIFSPDCPTWKIDNLEVLDHPFLVSYVTSAAVHNFNAQSREEIKMIHDERIKAILCCAICNGVKNIILGAFGCGAFRNSPEDVSQSFKHWLIDENLKDYFESISFSIIERRSGGLFSRNIDIFAKTFDLPIIETKKYDQKEQKARDLERKKSEKDNQVEKRKDQQKKEQKSKEKKQKVESQQSYDYVDDQSEYDYEYDDDDYYYDWYDYYYYYYNYYNYWYNNQ